MLLSCSLHWLLVPERTQYKLQAVLAYKVLHGDAPRYLGPLTRVDDLPVGRLSLRSTNDNRLAMVPPPVKLSTCSRQPSLCGCGSTRLEYTLPTDVVIFAANSLSTFRRQSKRFFIQAIVS